MIIPTYCILFALSLTLPAAYFLYLRKKQNEPWLPILFFSICTVDLGYLLLSVSETVGFALTANKIAYLGQISLLTCMFMLILRLCGFSYPKRLPVLLIALGVLVFSMVLTTGHLDWYYVSATITKVDGATKLVKVYGILHPFYTVFVISYFIAMLTVICISLKRSSEGSQHKLAGLMFAIVLGNVGMWIIEKKTSMNFEFLAISYFMSELIFFFVYSILHDYNEFTAFRTSANAATEKTSVIFVDSGERADKVRSIISRLPEGVALSPRQMEVLEGILDGKTRKEIAFDLHLSENTVKMHTSSLFKVLGVSGRDEIYAMLKTE